MKKYFLLGLLIAIIPNICCADSAYYSKLVHEKQRKMKELEKCIGSSKGLKIAGISTLGLTAVGVTTSIAQASKLKSYNEELNKIEAKIESAEKKLEQKRLDDAKIEQNVNNGSKSMLKDLVAQDLNDIYSKSGNIGDEIYAHAYIIDQLPNDLMQQYKTALESFQSKCSNNKGSNGITNVDAGVGQLLIDINRNINGRPNMYTPETPLDNTNKRSIGKCKATACNEVTYILVNNERCVLKDCTETAKKSGSNAATAEIDSSGNCKITKCSSGAISADKTKCE